MGEKSINVSACRLCATKMLQILRKYPKYSQPRVSLAVWARTPRVLLSPRHVTRVTRAAQPHAPCAIKIILYIVENNLIIVW